MKEYKCGNVVLIGEPNVGKSSIVNAIVGEQVSIVSDIGGTTRTQIRGIKTMDGYQIIFSDVPGMVGKKRNLLDKSMSKSISSAVADGDIILYVLDATNISDEFIQKIENYERLGKPLVLAVNKTDKTNFAKLYPKLEKLNKFTFVKSIIPISCKTKQNLDVLESELVKHLPQAQARFGSDEYTDQPVKTMAEEIIRGELLKILYSEIPHGIAVSITSWKEVAKEIEIRAEIYCDKPSHKPIIIGHKGKNLLAAGVASRGQIQELTGKHVRLYTHVLVREGWRDKV